MPEIPKGATVPDDHRKPAAQVEVEGSNETATLTFGEATFTIPADLDEVDGEFLKYAADSDSYRMIQAVLDEKQFNRFKALKPKIRDYKAMGDQIAVVFGFDSSGE